MNNSRGRPVGFKLSEESKDKISKSRTNTSQNLQTKRKISRSLKRYFKTPAGKAVREKNSVQRREEWHQFLQSEEAVKCKQEFKEAWINFLTSMHKFTKEN